MLRQRPNLAPRGVLCEKLPKHCLFMLDIGAFAMGKIHFKIIFFFTTRDGTFSINSNGTIMIPTGMPALYILVYLYSTKQLYVFAGG